MLRLYVTDPDTDTETEYTSLLRPDKKFEVGVKAFNGEADLGDILLDDPTAVLDWETEFAGHRRIRLTEDASGSEITLVVGRINSKEFERGQLPQARELTISLDDANADLRGIIVHNYIRPAETGRARVLATLAAYLNGASSTALNPESDPYGRDSTVIGSAYVQDAGNVSMPAETYDGTDPLSVLRACAEWEDKRLAVYIEDDASLELYYAPRTETAQLNCTLSVSDDPSVVDFDTVFEPHWIAGPALHTDSDEMISGALLIHEDGLTYDRREAVEAINDRWEEAVYSTKPVASGTDELTGLLDRRDQELPRIQFAIQLPAEKVHLVKACMRMEVQQAVAAAVVSSFYRIVNLRLAYRSPGTDGVFYTVIVTLETPILLGSAPRPRPNPFPPDPIPVPGAAEVCITWDFTSTPAASGLARTVPPSGWPDGDALLDGPFGRNSAVNFESDEFASIDTHNITAGVAYTFSLDFVRQALSPPVIIHWLDSGSIGVGTDTWFTPNSYLVGAEYRISATFVSPPDTDRILIFWDQNGVTWLADNITICATPTSAFSGSGWGPVLVATADGVDDSWTLPYPTAYVPGTLDVKVDGTSQTAIEDDPTTGLFSLSFVPFAGDLIYATWQVP